MDRFFQLTEETFRIASANLTDDDILDRIQRWINEDRSSSAVQSLENVYADLAEVLDSMRRIQILAPEGIQLPRSTANSVRVALIRRFFTEQLEFINVAKKYVDLEDFFDLMERIVFPPGSHGKLGGKSAGLFLATRILKQAARRNKIIGTVKKPKTWYITSDGLIAFTTYNNLDDVIEQKYKDIEVIRQEYPHLVQVFKNSTFPPEIVKGLSVALDDFGEVPLIVRSSSLLEDRLGTAFAGKYKSLFLANQGDKQQRLEALLDAVAEVYASIFSPDPIQYRAERGLLDFYEEMGVMIQEVVGTRAGKYFFPAFAGVAFSRNEFRWSPRIKREDGLLRLVPGLGTRAVDRVSDDYPVLVAPSQPNLRVNVSTDEAVRYSPKKIDVIDLEENRFVTKDIRELLDEVGHEYPALTKVFSIYRDGLLQRPMGLATDLAKADAVVTFEGLIAGIAVHAPARGHPQDPVRGDGRAGRHRVRLDGHGLLPPPVPPAKPGLRGRGHGDPGQPPRTRPSCSRPRNTSRTAASPTSPTSSTSTPTATASWPNTPTSSPSARPWASSTSSCRAASSSSWARGAGAAAATSSSASGSPTRRSTTRPCSSRSPGRRATTSPTCPSGPISSRTSSSPASATCRSTPTTRA